MPCIPAEALSSWQGTKFPEERHRAMSQARTRVSLISPLYNTGMFPNKPKKKQGNTPSNVPLNGRGKAIDLAVKELFTYEVIDCIYQGDTLKVDTPHEFPLYQRLVALYKKNNPKAEFQFSFHVKGTTKVSLSYVWANRLNYLDGFSVTRL